MSSENSCIAVCDNQRQAEKAMHLLQKKGFAARYLSVVGKDCPCDEYPLAVSEEVVVNGLSALGVALYRLAIPEDSIIRYEAAIQSDCYLLIVQGNQNEIERAHDGLLEGEVRDITIHLS